MRIAIESGHGGPDTGCGPYNGLIESHLVYQLALLLEGFEKKITRTENEDPGFHERANRAKDCDAALILHFNSGELRYSKPEFYYRGPDAPAFWFDHLDLSVTQSLTHEWAFPAPLGKRAAFFDTTLYARKGYPKELEWLKRANHCLEFYTVPTVLLEVGYLNDPKVSSYILDGGLVEIADSISDWVVNRVEENRALLGA
jgi:N-acetylmuramoyl-L-alanine amidase